MNIFLDTSVLLAACGSAGGASGYVCTRAPLSGWSLVATPYVLGEVERNLGRLPLDSVGRWRTIRATLSIQPDVLTLDRPIVFGPAKDRPIPFGALAWCEILLTLDWGDFGGIVGQSVYDLLVLTPSMFLLREREAKRLQ